MWNNAITQSTVTGRLSIKDDLDHAFGALTIQGKPGNGSETGNEGNGGNVVRHNSHYNLSTFFKENLGQCRLKAMPSVRKVVG